MNYTTIEERSVFLGKYIVHNKETVRGAATVSYTHLTLPTT